MTAAVEIVVIGGGVLGCAIAWRLAAIEPRDVLLLERNDLGSGASARRWKRMIESRRSASLTKLAEAETINRSYLCRILRLTLLALDRNPVTPATTGHPRRLIDDTTAAANWTSVPPLRNARNDCTALASLHDNPSGC